MPNQIEIERIDGASHALSGIIQKLQNSIFSKKMQPCDTLLVNILTLSRNVYDKEMNFKSIANQLSTDMNVLTFHFNEYVKNLKNTDNPSIVFYIPSYHTFPKLYLREESPTNIILSKFLQRVVKEIYPNEHYEFLHDNLRLFVVHVGKQQLPHFELQRKLNILNADCVRKNLRDYWLISHVPVDYHIIEDLHNRCLLLDSYTGNFWDLKHLGEKVFKNQFIPFNGTTHLMFGDQFLIKCSLNRRDKKQALETAKTHNWNLRTKQQILKEATNWLPESFYTTIKL